jgi:hypothetical protein
MWARANRASETLGLASFIHMTQVQAFSADRVEARGVELFDDTWSGEKGDRLSELVGILWGNSHNDCEKFLIVAQSRLWA